MNQSELEEKMYAVGVARLDGAMARAEERGRAHQNPYAKKLFDTYVEPLSCVVRSDIERKSSGGYAAHVQLLRPLDTSAVAYLSVRAVIDMLVGRVDVTERQLYARIGFLINSELVLDQISKLNPELYYSLANDLGRRLSRDEAHRMAVMRTQARDAGLSWDEWPLGAKEKVGAYLMGCLLDLGLVEFGDTLPARSGKTAYRQVVLSSEAVATINQIRGFVAISSPMYGPCVEPPVDWVGMSGGGFHTEKLRRANPLAVKCHPVARYAVRSSTPSVFNRAINGLQATRWRVNKRLLASVQELLQAGPGLKELVLPSELPAPTRPAHLPTSGDLTDDQQAALDRYKAELRKYHTDRRLSMTRHGRLAAALRVAEEFKDRDSLYFVYFADSRGRLYPRTNGISPQGSDLQKALLEFATGGRATSDEHVLWMKVNGANKFGFDKATLPDRAKWVDDRHREILSWADGPLYDRGWTAADKPLQFLAWCKEYASWCRDSSTPLHLPVAMDGSCNGLQHLSAMSRDEVGGAAVNLLPADRMADIYQQVADIVLAELVSSPSADALWWLQFGITRSLVKRTVMTTPYGVTVQGAVEHVVAAHLKHLDAKEAFSRARFLVSVLWPAVGKVVVKGREVMEWLSKGGRKIAKSLGDDTCVSWITPSGFPASQAHFKVKTSRIRTHLAGTAFIRPAVNDELPSPDPAQHSAGLAPNFVHSMDASHLHLVVASAASLKIDVAAIHDDYGTTPDRAPELYKLIRDEFVCMYESCDPMQALYERYPVVGTPPSKGGLDIRRVRDSWALFS